MRWEEIFTVLGVINVAARAYGRVLKPPVYHEPQMTLDEFLREASRIKFFVAELSGEIVGVAGYEYVGDVALIRHVYVKPEHQRRGIGSALLKHLESLIRAEGRVRRLIVGTYRAAYWAISFYQKHGFRLVENPDAVLRKYYDIPDIQRENSTASKNPSKPVRGG